MAAFEKGFLKNAPVLLQVFTLISTVILGLTVGQYLFVGFEYAKSGFALGDLKEFLLYANENAQLVRQMLFFQTLCAFFFPALILSRFFSDNGREYLHTENGFSGSVMLLTILGIIFILPFLNAVIYWTQQIPYPDSLRTQIIKWEEQAQHINEMILTTDSYFTFLMNLLIVAVLAAVGEEFIFRGVLQNILGKAFKNPHVVIWTVGIIFSLIHFQFYGFFARAFLGAYMGYLLYYSKSIWVPVLAHFTNNAIGVIGYYSIKNPEVLKKVDEVGTGSTLWVAFLSLALFSITFILLIRKCKSQNLLP